MDLSAENILNFTEPGELFSDNAVLIREEYSGLAKIWHPDCNGNSRVSNEVMAKINSLYKQGMEMIHSGIWRKPGFIRLHSKDGKVHEIVYLIETSFELGRTYICDKVAVYLIDERFKDLYRNAVRRIKGFTYANDKMRAEISKCLPRILSQFETMDNRIGIVFGKEPDLLSLKDVLAYYDGKLPDRHVAWILSTLYNIACYLNYSGLSHNAISPETCFISPVKHSGAILGGWWYSVPEGERMVGVPEKIYSILPPQVKHNKRGSILTDLESIRLIGRELLGDRTGARLEDSGVPGALACWLRGASAENAFDDYSGWGEVLKKSYGVKKFVEMDLTGKSMYLKLTGK